MPLHDVGYRPWKFRKTSALSRWWIIADTGVQLAFKSRWVRRLMLFAWIPVLYWGIAFFVIEQGMGPIQQMAPISGPGFSEIENEFPEGDLVLQEARNRLSNLRRSIEDDEFDDLPPDVREKLLRLEHIIQEGDAKAFESEIRQQVGSTAVRHNVAEQLREVPMIPNAEELADAIENGDNATVRHTIWSWLLMTFFRYPQGFLILFLIGFIAPSLISNDVRTRAFLMYFSKPINTTDYIVGKLFVLVFFIVGVTSLPAIALYLFAVMLSPDLAVIPNTWDIPIRIMVSTVFLVVPTASLALMLSSLTQETRFASFAWFAIWALGHGAWLAILFSQAVRMDTPPVESEVLQSPIVQQWSVLSLYNNLGDIQNWVFGFATFDEVWPGVMALGSITVFSLVVLFRRVKANIRI